MKLVVVVFVLALLGACSHDLDDVERPDAAVVDRGGPDLPGGDGKVKPDQALTDLALSDQTPPDQALPDMSTTCGNFKTESYEACDYTDTTPLSCAAKKPGTLGTPICTKQCTLDLRGCYTEVDSKPFQYSYSGKTIRSSLAASKTLAVSVFTDATPALAIKASRYSESLGVIDTKEIPLVTRTKYQRYPAVAGSGSRFLVVWEDYSNVKAQFIGGTRVESITGKVLDPKGLVVALDSTAGLIQPQVSADATGYVVVYTRWFTYADILAQRVMLDGTVPTAAPIKITDTNKVQEAYPSVTLYKGKHLVTYMSLDVYGRRIKF